MVFKHDGHYHDVLVEDDGTLDTVLTISYGETGEDWATVRYSEVKRRADGSIPRAELIRLATEACEDGLLSDDDTDGA